MVKKLNLIQIMKMIAWIMIKVFKDNLMKIMKKYAAEFVYQKLNQTTLQLMLVNVMVQWDIFILNVYRNG